MIKKNIQLNKFWKNIVFFLFLFGGFFYISIKTICYALEISYPAISGTTLTDTSKLPDFAVYLFNAGMSIGLGAVFISLVIAGAMFFLSPVSPEMRSSAKDRVAGAITGLLILILTYLIISTINPQLSVFNVTNINNATIPTITNTESPGVYFYKDSSCSDTTVKPRISNVHNLEELKKKVNSIKIVQDTANGNYYISMVYEHPNFWGKCSYVDPNSSCQSDTFFTSAVSASIYQYDSNPSGQGIYFFRKPCFNQDTPYINVADLITQCKGICQDGSTCTEVSAGKYTCGGGASGTACKPGGGYLKVSNSDIQNGASGSAYEKDLNTLQFTGDSASGGSCTVPKDEQDCTKYDKSGNCESQTCPTLAGENISSIIMDGNYLLVFYHNSSGTTMSSCQEFPTSNDANAIGPHQIKWEMVRNTENAVPAGMFIIPIKPRVSSSSTTTTSTQTNISQY